MQSEQGMRLRALLVEMTQNENYNTRTTYSTIDKDGISFVEKHMKYMSLYPNLNHKQYISNLKLKTKIR